MDSKEQEKLIRDLIIVEKTIAERERVTHVSTYGLPDLLFPIGYKPGKYVLDYQDSDIPLDADVSDGWVRERLGYHETPEQYAKRQNTALEEVVTNHLKIIKDGKEKKVFMIRAMHDFISGVFFLRTTKVIVWKPRGGGGSLSAAILIFLLMAYRKREVLDLAGCLLPETLVWVQGSGWVKVSDVCIGDTVYSSDGKLHKVNNVTSKKWGGYKIKVVPYGYSGNEFTPDHRISVLKNVVSYSGKRQRLIKPDTSGWDAINPVWCSCESLTKNDTLVIARPKYEGTSLPTVAVCANSNGLGKPVNIDWTPDLTRFIGYWLAEGDVHKNAIRLNVNSEALWLDDYKDIVKRLFNRNVTYYEPHPGKTKEAVMSFSCRDLALFLTNTFGKYSYGKKIPSDLITGLKDDSLWGLLIGYLRGDGCGKKTSRGALDVSLSTVSEELASSIYWASIRLGVFPALLIENPKARENGFCESSRQLYAIRWGSVDADILLEKAFPWITQKVRKPRQRHVWFTENNLYVGIRHIIKSEYSGDVWDLCVDDNPSFAVPYMCVHNSGEQAMCVYNYVRDFCDLIPGFSNMIAGDTTKSKATFLNGGDVLAIPATDKQVRGKHKSVLIIDEACQNDREIVFKAALQGTMSEDDPIVVLLSTFHLPSGFYQEHWDGAEEKGFHKVRWSIIDTMSPCVKWQEYLTKTDPDGHDFCMNRCPFTVNKQVMDASGKLTFKEKTGCCGSGRTSDGWLSYEKVLAPYKLNLGTSIFDIEYLCSRPNYENSVYSPELVDDALSIPLSICSTDDLAVGIDWGLETTNSLAITLVARQLEYLYIHACVLTDHKLVKDVADLLNSWMTIAGKRFPILADSSHPFNNAELSQAGFDVRPVNFGTWKKFGIENVSKYLTFRRIKINQELLILISQLKKFRRDTRGRIVKHEDHAVDSAMCAILNWKFEEEFGEDIARARVLDPVERFTLPRAAYSFDDSGIAKVVVAGALKKDVQETGVKEKGSILLI